MQWGQSYTRFVEYMSRRLFTFWERFGVHITPVHYYYPIPDTRRLPESLWTRASELAGIELGGTEQAALLDKLSSKYRDEYDRLPLEPSGTPWQYYVNNGLFEAVDGEILYCFIREFRPRRIVEIGSGFSTRLAAQAALRNRQESGIQCELVCYDPHPSTVVKTGFPGLTQVVSKPVQDVPIAEFATLGENDILFIDSSHVLAIGSDVHYEYLEILPRVQPGVLIHVHDIFLPFEYPREWVLEKRRFWSEQYLLQAFLSFNDSFRTLWAGAYVASQYPNRLAAAFRTYRPGKVRPGSYWIRRVR